jgi:peptidoglycan/LPS O-acetylase OafA/YrhL
MTDSTATVLNNKSNNSTAPKISGLPMVVGERNNNFNFLRLVFAILVLLSHSPELVDGNRSREILTKVFGTISFGELAVEGFFLLSGYMIIKSWLQKPDLKAFGKKRIARIYPGFIVATLFSIFLFGLLGANNMSSYLHSINYLRCLFFAITLMGPPTPDTFNGTPYPIVNGAMWTLSYEFRCYMLVAILGVYGINGCRKIWLFILAFMITVVFACSFFDINKYNFFGSFYIFGVPSEIIQLFSCFATGACFYLYHDKVKYKFPWAVTSFFMLICCLFYSKITNISFCILGGYCIFYFSFCNINILKIFQKFPDISYGLYLYGWPIQKLLLWNFPSLSPWTLFLLAWVVSSIFGFMSWKLVESPALQLASKYLFNHKKITTS